MPRARTDIFPLTACLCWAVVTAGAGASTLITATGFPGETAVIPNGGSLSMNDRPPEGPVVPLPWTEDVVSGTLPLDNSTLFLIPESGMAYVTPPAPLEFTPVTVTNPISVAGVYNDALRVGNFTNPTSIIFIPPGGTIVTGIPLGSFGGYSSLGSFQMIDSPVIPEPSSALLGMLGALACLRRKR